MSKNIIIAAFAALFMTFGLVNNLPARSSFFAQKTQIEEVPSEVVQLACQAVVKERMASEAIAMQWYRTGQLVITKTENGAYAVITPSGAIILIETSAL